MAEYKPLGSEKLNKDEKLKRILELAYYERDNNKKNNKSNVIKESSDGSVFGIVKEKDGYYVKRGLNESSLDYIGGMFMKNKNRFSSYAEALKRMELLRANELQEATKYVLKQKSNDEAAAPSLPPEPEPEPAPDVEMAPAPDAEMPPAPDTEMSSEPAADMPPAPDAEMPSGDEQSKKSDYMSEVQKYAGKLGQELRDQAEKMEGDDIKYVLNMIISAVDLDKLELEDLEEIGKKFEREEEEEGASEDVPEMPSDEEIPAEEPTEPAADSDLGEETDPSLKLEKFVNNNSYDTNEDVDFEKYAISELGETEEETVELDMDEIKSQIANSVNATLSKYFK